MIKAIETRYKGYRFRSRLEARRAVQFDDCGLTWEYEPEGFELPDGTRYLPDFYIRGANWWIEIKADEPTPAEMRKSAMLCIVTGHSTFILIGQPDPNIVKGYVFNKTERASITESNWWPPEIYFNMLIPVWEFWPEMKFQWYYVTQKDIYARDSLQNNHPLVQALKNNAHKGRGARFEFGENG